MSAPILEELIVLKEFRTKIAGLHLKEEDQTDLLLLRWLRARDLDIPRAFDMLEKSIEWRKVQAIDTVLTWTPPPSYRTEYAWEIVGMHPDGQPIAVVPFGVWDVRKAISSGGRETWLRYVDQFFAAMFAKFRENSKVVGHEVTQFIAIVDMANFSMRQLTSLSNVESILEVVRRFESNYPEIFYAGYFVNASRIFAMLFALIKPLLSARTLSKIEIYTSPSKWKPVLLNNMPEDQIPPEFGGTRVGRRVSIGSSAQEDQTLSEGLEFNTVNIGAGQKVELEYAVTRPGSKITWKFRTDAYDIGFFITLDRRESVLIDKRYHSHLFQEEGGIDCKKLGEYFITFDNTYSKMRGKTLHYLVDLVEPPNGGTEIIETAEA